MHLHHFHKRFIFPIFMYTLLALTMLQAPRIQSHPDDHSHECLPCKGSKLVPRRSPFPPLEGSFA